MIVNIIWQGEVLASDRFAFRPHLKKHINANSHLHNAPCFPELQFQKQRFSKDTQILEFTPVTYDGPICNFGSPGLGTCKFGHFNVGTCILGTCKNDMQ